MDTLENNSTETQKGMNVKELREQLVNLYEAVGSRHDNEIVSVKAAGKGSCGGTSTVPVTKAVSGFDWDRGKLILFTEEELRIDKK